MGHGCPARHRRHRPRRGARRAPGGPARQQEPPHDRELAATRRRPDLAHTTFHDEAGEGVTDARESYDDDGFVAGCGGFDFPGGSSGSGAGTIEIGGEIDAGCGIDVSGMQRRVRRMIWFLLVAVTVGLGGLLARRHLLAGPGDLAPEPLDGAKVGYLVGGPKRAVAAVLAGLRVDGSIAFTDGRVVKERPAAQTWGRLGPVIRIAAATGTGVKGLLHHATVADALHAMRADLTARGWLLSERDRHRARLIGAPMWALAAVGLVLVVHAAATDRPFGWWIVATGAVGYAAGWLSRAPELHTGARRALERFTAANAHLSPADGPSLLTYGAATAAVAVGLFGTNVLLPLDPGLAVAADLMSVEPERPATRELADAGSSCAGGGGGGGGSSCGGGCGGCGGGE